MWKLIIYTIIQSVLLVSGQVFLKFALMRMPSFGWNRMFWVSLLQNWQFAISGLLLGSGSLLWMYIIKHFPLSVAYPMNSLSYVFGIIAAVFFFHEEAGFTKWAGITLIMGGCFLITR